MNLKKLAILLVFQYNNIFCMSLVKKKPSKLPFLIRLDFDKHNQTEANLKKVIEHFLQNQGDIEAIDSKGETMLTRVCQKGYVEIIKFLYSKGANIETKDNSDLRPLEWSILEEQEKSIETL